MLDNSLYREDLEYACNLKIDWHKLKNKKVLITGATGLIGTFMIDTLMHKNKVDNMNIKIYIISRNEEKILNRFKMYNPQKVSSFNDSNLIYIIQNVCDRIDLDIDFDFIIHGASNTHPILYSTDPVGTITTNVLGFYNILEYAKCHVPKRILLLSTVEVYGENRGDVEYFDEDYCGYLNCNNVRSGYPESKRVCESLAQSYRSKYNLDINIGRLSRIYGPTMQLDDSKAIAQFIKHAVNGEDIVLKSDGSQLFSFCYVADAVTALLTILLNGEDGQAYNIADKNSDIELKQLAQLLSAINNKCVIFEIPNDVEKKGYSNSKKALLSSKKINSIGWNAKYDIESGVKRTVEILRKM